VAVGRRWRQRFPGQMLDDATILASIVAVAIVVVLVSAATVRSLYAVPLLIPLATLAAGDPALVEGRRFGRATSIFTAFCAVLAGFVWCTWLYGIVRGTPPPVDFLSRWLPTDFDFRFDGAMFAVALGVTAIAAATWTMRSTLAVPLRWL